jgi:hypothetical protein
MPVGKLIAGEAEKWGKVVKFAGIKGVELRATLDCLELSAAEAGHLFGVHRATVYRWLDGSTSVPIVVELLLRLMVRRGIRPAEVTASRHGRTSAKPRSGRS